MNILPSDIYHFIGKKKGKCVVIMAGIHGNERISVQVIEKLKNLLLEEKLFGEIYLIIGNPTAYEYNVRFVHEDLNRLFDKETIECIKKDSSKQLNTEQKRVLEIILILEKIDFLLDIHSTINPSVPFVFTKNTKKHLEIA